MKDWDWPCTFRGPPTGEMHDCGCGLEAQPVFACNHPALSARGCVIRTAKHRKTEAAGLLSCASCNFRSSTEERLPESPPEKVCDSDRPLWRDQYGLIDPTKAYGDRFKSSPQRPSLATPDAVANWKAILQGPPGHRPEGWAGLPEVHAAFRELLREKSQTTPPMPEWSEKRGIVICGGGWKFFASLYVTVRMIRAVGCTLPIEVWYLGDRGEYDERMELACVPYGVRWIDANAFCREHGIPQRILGGWELKPLAAAYSRFQEVICLDADCYPAYNPERFLEHPEYQRVGAAFWPDVSHVENGKLHAGQWELFGLPYHDEPGWESGQFIIDKARHWRPLWLTWWMNQHSDYVYQHMYGDKDTFHICWRLCGHETCIPATAPRWQQVAFLQLDFAAEVLFVHRCRDKFRLQGEIDGAAIDRSYSTSQTYGKNKFLPMLPREEEAHRFLEECDQLLRPDRFFTFSDEHCRRIWDGIVLGNVYRAEIPPGATVVDIGANCGAFAKLAFLRWAARVVCVEPVPENVAHLRHNVPQAEVIEAAVGGTHLGRRHRSAADYSVFAPAELAATTISLSTLLEQAVQVLKINCEGAEYTILEGADLSRVDAIYGEAHPWAGNPQSLFAMLKQRGFHVETFDNSGSLLFKAKRC